MNIFKKLSIGDSGFSGVYSSELDTFEKENEMKYVNKLVEKISSSNKGMIIKAVGITADGEIKIIKTSKNANAYKTMVKNDLVEIYLSGVHHYRVDTPLHEIVNNWTKEAEEIMNNICEAGDFMVGLQKHGVGEGRARYLADDYLATA